MAAGYEKVVAPDLSGPGWTDGQHLAAKTLKDAVAANQAMLSLAQQNGLTAAMIDVITEFVKNSTITPAKAASRLADAVESNR